MLCDGRLVEIFIDRAGGASLVGNIYLGRIGAVKNGLNAAFVSFGESKDGFLSLPEARPALEAGGRIGDYARGGAAVRGSSLMAAEKNHHCRPPAGRPGGMCSILFEVPVRKICSLMF